VAAVPDQTRDATARRVPDFFVVGAPKSGTTSLYWMLRQHPQIFMPDLKEPQFLASDAPARDVYYARALPGSADKRPRPIPRPRTLEDYLALFADAAPGQRVGESSTFYLLSRDAATRIAELAPDARIIAILREPVSFLRSLHLTALLISYETEKSLSKAMSLEAARREGRRVPRHAPRPQLLQYSEHVRYVEKLRRFEERFPPGHVQALIYDDLWGDTDAIVHRVLRFLEVDEDYPIHRVNTNVTRRAVRSPRLKAALESLAAWRGPPRAGRAEQLLRRTVRGARRRAVMGDAPAMDDQFALELRRRLRSEVVALSDHLGRDLVALWGYDAVADAAPEQAQTASRDSAG
jgi:Sulfotransferase family